MLQRTRLPNHQSFYNNNDLITQYSWYLQFPTLSFSGSPDLPVINPGTNHLKLKATSSHNCSIPHKRTHHSSFTQSRFQTRTALPRHSLINLLINPLLKHRELSTNGTGILEMGILKLIKTQKILTLHQALFKSFLLLHQIKAAPTLSLKPAIL
jgi:hypothetical protein